MPKSSLAAGSRAASTASAVAGSASSFAELVATAFGIARCLRPEAEAVALVQASASATRRERRLPDEDLRLWFLRILVRTHVDSRSPALCGEGSPSLDDTPDLYLYARSAEAGLPIDGPEPAGPLLDRMGADRVIRAMERLAEEYRLVCSCYFMADLTYEEIALVLGYPVGTVRARLHRGRRMLQKALWQVAQEDGITPLEREAAT